jgi:UDP-glucose:(heptosyl)LPS alpha-1,3-glucosyltransferase
MRIGLAIYNFDPKKGGAERYAFDLATILAAKGHEIIVFCASGRKTPGITLVPVSTMRYPRWFRSLSFALSHRKAVRSGEFKLDVVLGFGNTLEFDVYQSHGGIQKIWMEREIASYDNPRERALKALLLKNSINQKIQQWIAESSIRAGRYHRIVAISDMVRRHMSQYYSIDRDRIDIVYNGVDTERFHPAERIQGGPLQILFSAGNFRLKGLLPLLMACADVAKKSIDFRLTVMGRGRKERYEPVIDGLKIRDRVTFLGETPSPEAIYRQAHVLVHPTFYDACSLTTMEAMASGVPVVTTAWNGASALVSTGDDGFVIDEPGDVSGISSALEKLANEERRRAMGRNARLKLEQYTIQRNADLMEHILLEVFHEKRRN